MNEISAAVAAPSSAAAQIPRRWPAAIAFLTAGIVPATTAHRTAHVSLLAAYAVHFLAALLSILVVGLMVAAASTAPRFSLTQTWQHFVEGLGSIFAEVQQFPGETALAVCIVLAAVELGILGQAFTLMAWGAQDEPLRRSFRHALGRVLLHTAHVPLVICCAGSAVTLLNHANARWEARYRVPAPVPPARALATPGTGAQTPASQKAWQDYRTARRMWLAERRAAKPWLLRHHEVFTAHPIFASVAWVVWALFRAVGTRGPVQRITRPPTCEECGYNLTMTPLESRCPECGEPVTDSLGPNARAGPPWEHRGRHGAFRTWWQTAWHAVIHPKRFGRALPACEPTTAHRRYVALHLPLVFLIAAASISVAYFIDTGRNPLTSTAPDPDVMLGIAPGTGCMCVFATVAVSLFCASLVGTSQSLQEKRNLLPVAMQAAAYLFPFLTLWCLFGAVSWLGTLALYERGVFELLLPGARWRRGVGAALIWLAPNALLGVRYYLCMSRITANGRYANR